MMQAQTTTPGRPAPVEGLLEAALHYHGLGLNVIPCGKMMGGRWDYKVASGAWKDYQGRRQTIDDVRSMPWHEATGIAVVHGNGSEVPIRTADMDCLKDDSTTPPTPTKKVPYQAVKDVAGAMGIDADSYEWIVETGWGWHVPILCSDLQASLLDPNAPPDPTVKKQEFEARAPYDDMFGKLELRWCDHMTLLPPSQHSPGRWYKFKNCERPSTAPVNVDVAKVVESVKTACTVPQPSTTTKKKTPNSGTRFPESHQRRSSVEWTPDKVRGMLKFVPAHQEHILWKKTVAAVVDALGSVDAVPVLEEWSPIPSGQRQYEDVIRTGLDRVTAGTLVHLARVHGWEGKTKVPLVDLVQAYLLSSFDLRYNELRRQLEHRLRDGDVWHVATDRTFEQWAVSFEKVHKTTVTPEKVRIYAQDKDVCQSYDPIKEYFDALPLWDGHDHIEALARTVTLQDEDYRTMFVTHLKRWLVGTYACGYFGGTNGNKNELIFILQGGQGVGKTTFLRRLIPAELEAYRCEHYDVTNKKDMYSILSKSFVCIDEELSSMTKKETEDFKKLLSSESFEFRSVYGRVETNHVRRVSFCGSTNESSFLRDTTGTRRYLVHAVEGLNRDDLARIEFGQVWAQAVALHEQGFRHYLHGEEVNELQRMNSAFETNDHLEDTLLRFLRPPLSSDRGTWLRTTEVAELLVRLHDEANTVRSATHEQRNAVTRIRIDTASLNRLGNLLVKHGFKRERKKIDGDSRQRYYVTEIGTSMRIAVPSTYEKNTDADMPF